MEIFSNIKRQVSNRGLFRQNSQWAGAIILFISSACCTAGAAEKAYQSLPAIEKAAKLFLEEKQISADTVTIEVRVSSIDSRTLLPACDVPLAPFLSQGMKTTGTTTVGVRCDGSRQWKIFVPARVEQFQEVWVVKRTISDSDIVTRQDLQRQKVKINGRRGVPLQELALIVNASPKRLLRSGSIIYRDSLCMVCRGDKVNVSANSDYLAINVDGVALTDAAMGETAQVRNTQSKRIFAAVVTGKNQLSINLGGTSVIR